MAKGRKWLSPIIEITDKLAIGQDRLQYIIYEKRGGVWRAEKYYVDEQAFAKAVVRVAGKDCPGLADDMQTWLDCFTWATETVLEALESFSPLHMEVADG